MNALEIIGAIALAVVVVFAAAVMAGLIEVEIGHED
jgi:hypothetical protein